MRLVAFESGQGPGKRPGPRLGILLEGGDVLDVAAALDHERTPVPVGHFLDWLDLDGPALQAVRTLAGRVEQDAAAQAAPRSAGAVLGADRVRLLAPVPRPGKVICIGLNYRDHARESGMAVPDHPVVFSKFPTAVCGPDDPVRLPAVSAQVDYEAELAVVIGRTARRVSRERALDHVLGYAGFNDVSARDLQFADSQWQRGKSCDTFGPLGPFIATTDEVPDPHRLGIRFRLNGRTLQDSSTDQLIFGVPELVAYLSETITLEPGDVIATGTPPGVGFARKPPVFLKDGDVMEVEIDGLGVLRNPVRADSA